MRTPSKAAQYIRKAFVKGLSTIEIAKRLKKKEYTPKNVYGYIHGMIAYLRRRGTKRRARKINIVNNLPVDESGFVKAIANIGLIKARETIHALEKLSL